MSAKSPMTRPKATPGQLIGWALLGGVACAFAFICGGFIYDLFARPQSGGGLGGAMFAYGLFWTLAWWLAPVFVIGAIAEAILASKSRIAAISVAATLFVAGTITILLLAATQS